MGIEATINEGVHAISVRGEITDTRTEGHRDGETDAGARLLEHAICIRPGANGDAECFIPGSKPTIVSGDRTTDGHTVTGLTGMAVGRGIWLLTQKSLISKLQAVATALSIIIDRCGNGDTCVLNYRQESEICDVHIKSFQHWMNRLAADGWITKKPKGQEGVLVTLNVQRVGCVDVYAAAQKALTKAEEQLGHMKAIQNTLLQDSFATIADARKTLG